MPFARDDFGRAEKDLLRVYAPFRDSSARSRSPVVFSVSMTFRIPPPSPPMTAGCARSSNDSLAAAEKSGASAFREGEGGGWSGLSHAIRRNGSRETRNQMYRNDLCTWLDVPPSHGRPSMRRHRTP